MTNKPPRVTEADEILWNRGRPLFCQGQGERVAGSVAMRSNQHLRWEFIKENKKVRKQELDQESEQKKTTRTRPRKRSRKQESDQEKKKKLSFFLDHFLDRVLVFFYKFPPL